MDPLYANKEENSKINGIKAKLDNEVVFLDVHSARLYIKDRKETREVKLKEIKSLHTKNEEAYHLKLKLPSSSLVFTFDNHNGRDLIKNILLKYIKPEEKVVEEVLQRNSTIKQLYANTKGLVGPEAFWGVHKDKILETYNIMLQQPSREMNYEADEFVYSLPPAFLRIFGDMNCSINQFYNYVRQSNFFDIRNPPNCIDRMLIDCLRDYKIDTNYAVRLNNQSLVTLGGMNSWDALKEFSTIPPKSTDFEPIYYLEEVEEEKMKTGYEVVNKKLTCNLDLEVDKKDEDFKFDKKDVKKVVDLSKLVFKCQKNKIDFSKEISSIEMFLEELKKKYKTLKYFKRILPTSFMHKLEK